MTLYVRRALSLVFHDVYIYIYTSCGGSGDHHLGTYYDPLVITLELRRLMLFIRVLENSEFRKICRKTPAMEPVLVKLQIRSLLQAQEFCEIFQYFFFTDNPRGTASVTFCQSRPSSYLHV